MQKAKSTTLKAGNSVKNYANFWKSVKIRFFNPTTRQSKESYVNYITTNIETQTISMDNITNVFPAGNDLEGYIMIQGIYVGKFPGDEELYNSSLKTVLKEEKLETLDSIS